MIVGLLQPVNLHSFDLSLQQHSTSKIPTLPMPTLVYNCPSGISGDMNLGAMIGLGVDPSIVEKELKKLPYHGWQLHFQQDQRGGISGTRCNVHLEHEHSEQHTHADTTEHVHRSYTEIRQAIEGSTLSERVKTDAIACFRVLAEAEGTVHGVPPEKVHFHEVGAIDSIVDIVGAAICWEQLGVDRILCQSLEVGGGTVQCAHGIMPVPAPATARLLTGKPYTAGATDKETTTPTGAALLLGKHCEFGATTSGRQTATSIGVGQRDDPKLPNVLYVSLIDESTGADPTSDQVWELAVNLDDMSGEEIGFLCQRIREHGVLDCWQVPAYFKKGRPGIILHCLVNQSEREQVEETLFQHSHSLGIRRQRWERSKRIRKETVMETEFGPVRAKTSQKPDGTGYRKFEYEDCARIARETGKTIREVRSILDQLLK